jgi:PIN domain nuclease of toxin-antitoxin system
MGSALLILLDTHIWIWFNADPEKLPRDVALAFAEGGEFCISAITVWEKILAIQKGRLKVPLPAEEASREWLVRSPIAVVPIDTEIAFLARTLRFEHSDPADQFIAATAFHLNCRLATVDSRLRRLSWLQCYP